MKKTFAVLLILGLCATQTVLAYGPAYQGPGFLQGRNMGPGWPQRARPMPRHQRDIESPRALLKKAVGKMRGFMAKDEASDKMKLMAFLETEISPFFDFAYMTKWIAGKRYADMSESEKSAMAGQIKEMFLSSLVRGLGGGYGDSRLQVTFTRPARNNEMQVGLRVLRRNGPPVKMKFRFYRADREWKIFDVVAFNSSAVIYFRNHFKKS